MQWCASVIYVTGEAKAEGTCLTDWAIHSESLSEIKEESMLIFFFL